MKSKHKFIYLLIILCLLTSIVLGQEIKNKWAFNGNTGVYGDFYSMHSDPNGAVRARRPGSLYQVVGNASLSYGRFSIPASISFSSGKYSVIYPKLPKGNLIDFIRNPANQIGIAPTYKWVQVMLGTQIPQYSELSVGDLPVFGAGINLTPGKFRFAVFGGTSQLAIEEDTTRNSKGIFARKIYSAKIGYGTEEASHLYIISSIMKDDTNSLKTQPVNTMPQNGVLSSVDYKIKIGKQYSVNGEFAGSAFTRDTRSKWIEPSPFFRTDIFRAQEASRFDYASAMSIAKEGKIMKLKLKSKYIGDGFVSMGYPFMQTDRLEVSLDPSFNLFQNKLQLSGSIGRRVNNLSGIRAATNTQTIASSNINYQHNEKLSLSASFSNFDFRNSISNDTLKIQMVTMSWSLSPTYTFSTPLNIHAFSAMYSASIFKDFNTISGALNDNNTRNTVLTYMLAKVNTPLSLSVLLSNFNNKTSIGLLAVNSINLSVGYKYFKNKLNTTFGITLNQNQLVGKDAGMQLMNTLGLKYSLKKKIDLAINGSINLFKYGIDNPGLFYQENLLRTSVIYKF